MKTYGFLGINTVVPSMKAQPCMEEANNMGVVQ